MFRANQWTVADIYGRRYGAAAPTTAEKTNPSDEVQAPDPVEQHLAVAGLRFPWEATVLFFWIGLIAAGWWVTRKVG